MKLTRLEIQALPGIEPGFVLDDLAPGVNMVTGPNGVGKSSLLRALGYLLAEPNREDPLALALHARFENGAGWTVRRSGSQVQWERDGRRAEPPPLPQRDQLHCYWLSMEELLRADDRDASLVTELRRALAGGYDLQGLRALSFQAGPRIGQNEARDLQDAQTALRQVQSDYEALRRQESELPQLQRRIDAAREAGRRMQQLRQALDLLGVVRQRRELEAGLATFPACMPLLRGDEPERLRRAGQGVEACRAGLDRLAQQREDLQASLAATGLGDERPDEATLSARRAALEAIRRQCDQLEQQRGQLEAARGEVITAQRALGGGEQPARLRPADVDAAQQLARRIAQLQAQRVELSARIDAVEAVDAADLLRHQQAVAALREWLSGAAPAPRLQRLAMGLAAGGGLGAAVAGAVSGAWWVLPGAGLALFAAVWALLGTGDAGRGAAQRRFGQAGLPPPEAWAREAVAARLAELEQALVELQRLQVRAGEARELGQRRQRIDAELAQCEQEKTALAAELGFDPAFSAAALDTFAHRVNDLQRALEREAGLGLGVERLQADITAGLERLSGFLRGWGVSVAPRVEDLGAALESLAVAVRQADAAQRDLAVVERDAERLRQDLSGHESDIQRLYQALGMQPQQRAELEGHCQRLDDWRQRQEQHRDAQRREAERRETLAPELLARIDNSHQTQPVQAPDGVLALELALEGTGDVQLESELASERESGLERELERDLEKELRDCEHQAEGLDALLEAHTAIRTRLAVAGGDQRLEQAWARQDGAQAALRDRREELLLAEAGGYLLDGVEQEYRSEQEPAVLHDARARFERFTHHAWQLLLDDAAGFMAREAASGAVLALDQLSSGTRMQLLLAVRLAWARRLEQGGVSLPLFLDEALTSSDETRFGAVAQSLEQLAREEGRQVFYLSARQHEHELWQRLTGQAPHRIDLARVRFGRASTAADYTLPEAPQLPAPGTQSAAAYAAALGVPRLDPQQPAGALHPFYLLRDQLPLLYRLLQDWRIDALGSLRQLLESRAADALGDAALQRRLRARCLLAEAWCAAWRQGRGRVLDRPALEASGAVTDAFIEAVDALTQSLGGDAQAVVRALRDGAVKGFRKTSLERLEPWLLDNGYIDTRPRLDADARCREALRVALERASGADASDLRQVLDWLEAGAAQER